MQKYWIKRQGNPDLILVVLGWACDPHAVEHLTFPGYDLLCTCDYRTLEPLDRAEFGTYGRVILFAWSFGVWVSEQICREVPLHRAVAFNGTPYPVDDRFGIPRKALMVTLKGIHKVGIEAFNRRTYGASYDRLAPYFETRPLEERVDELQFLFETSMLPYTPSLPWNDAVIGREDVIFPPKNMIAYWGNKAHLTSGPHYPFGDPEVLREYLDPMLTMDHEKIE